MDPRVIKNKSEYEKALEETERLIALEPEPGTPGADRLDLLSVLIEKYEDEQFPIEIPDPIYAIRFRMKEKGLRQRDLIPYIGSKSKVSEILSGKRPLTIQMIRALHEGLGIPAEVLLQEQKDQSDNEDQIEWDKFPIREMVKRCWIEAKTDELQKYTKELLQRFFKPLGGAEGLGTLCRRTFVERSGRSMDKYALLAWTAQALLRANELEFQTSYKPGSVTEEFMEEVLSLSPSEKGPVLAKEFLVKHGIALIIEPHLPRTLLDAGAMLAPSGIPVIGLTIRHDRIDNFWFNLLHELVHVSKHLNDFSVTFIDDLDSDPGSDPREREADRIAGEILIPRRIWRRSDAYRQRTPEAIEKLADKLNIHPAIIAGRIRHDANNYYILTQMIGNRKVRKLFPDVNWQ